MTNPENKTDPGPPPSVGKPAPPMARGLMCPACNGDRLGVDKTRRAPGRMMRVRRCLDCDRRFRTAERVESARV